MEHETSGNNVLGTFTVRKFRDIAEYRRACAEREIELSKQVWAYLESNLYRFGKDAGGEVSYHVYGVGELYPDLERSDVERYKFKSLPQHVTFSDLKSMMDASSDAPEKFMSSVRERIKPQEVALLDIRKVTLEMIYDALYARWCDPFSHLGIMNLILNVTFPVLPAGSTVGEISLMPETALWKRVWHKPFMIRKKPMQLFVGIRSDGQKSVEMLPINPRLGFTREEVFLCQAH